MTRKSAQNSEGGQAVAERQLDRRVLVNIRRADDVATTYCCAVWMHEVPILESIHGVERDYFDDNGDLIKGGMEIVDLKTVDQGYSGKIDRKLMPHWTPQPQQGGKTYDIKDADVPPRPSEAMKLGYVFVGDPRAEYTRLQAVYGRHMTIDVTMVEHLYGRYQEGRFRRVVSGATLEDLPAAQLRDMLADSVGIDRPTLARAERPELLVMCEEHGITV